MDKLRPTASRETQIFVLLSWESLRTAGKLKGPWRVPYVVESIAIHVPCIADSFGPSPAHGRPTERVQEPRSGDSDRHARIAVAASRLTVVADVVLRADARSYVLARLRRYRCRDLNRRDLNRRDLNRRDLNRRDLNRRDLDSRDLNRRDLDSHYLDLGYVVRPFQGILPVPNASSFAQQGVGHRTVISRMIPNRTLIDRFSA